MTITNYALIRHEFDFSAVYVAEDSTLHQSIRSFAVKESKLLYSIGIAPMEEEIQKRVIELTKQNQDSMVEEFGIQSSLTEEDMKQYLQEVINEVQKYKTTTNKTNNGNTKTLEAWQDENLKLNVLYAARP